MMKKLKHKAIRRMHFDSIDKWLWIQKKADQHKGKVKLIIIIYSLLHNNAFHVVRFFFRWLSQLKSNFRINHRQWTKYAHCWEREPTGLAHWSIVKFREFDNIHTPNKIRHLSNSSEDWACTSNHSEWNNLHNYFREMNVVHCTQNTS